MGGRLELQLSCAARRCWSPRRAQFAAWAGAALAELPQPAVLSVRIVGTVRSRSLNARYRHKDRPTNVLSFAGAGLAPDGRRFIGELVLCAPLVDHEARRAGKTVLAHWAHLTVHGVLHLLGFDHERADQARKMAAAEVQILDRLGFSNPYA
jgi:probable rRNA maturation factor